MAARRGDISSMLEMLPPFAFRAAATLRLSDHVDDHPDLAGLARATGTDPDALRRLLRYLVHLGAYREPEQDRFEPTPAGRMLVGRDEVGLREWLDLDGAGGRMELALAGLAHSVRTGRPGFDAVFGRSYWEDLATDASLAASFDELMAAKSRPVAADLARHDWSGVDCLVDVGGGRGFVLAEILAANPGLHGVLFEQAATAGRARAVRDERGLAGRFEIVTGSFLEHVPPGFDGYLLFDVLHNWDDEQAAAILGRCAAAAHAGGQVFVVEEFSGCPPDRNAAAMDLKMLALFGGRQRSADEIVELARGAGLASPDVRSLPSGFGIAAFRTAAPAPGGQR